MLKTESGLLTMTDFQIEVSSRLEKEIRAEAIKEFAEKLHQPIGRVKTVYDLLSCVLGVALSLIFFGKFVGVSWGTFVCAALNGLLIGMFGKLLEKNFDFKDRLKLRSVLE